MDISNSKNQLLLNLLSAATMRNRVLTNNLVNEHTPGYTRETVDFEDLLAQKLDRGEGDLLAIAPEVVQDELSPASPDGNNVNVELELNGIAQNRLQYELYSTILSGRMELMRAAIQEGR